MKEVKLAQTGNVLGVTGKIYLKMKENSFKWQPYETLRVKRSKSKEQHMLKLWNGNKISLRKEGKKEKRSDQSIVNTGKKNIREEKYTEARS